jgi:hypothetical protein
VEVFAEVSPVFGELHSRIGEAEAPGPRAEECIEVEAEARHARDSRGKRDEGADDGEKASDEDCDLAVFVEEAIGEFEVVFVEQDVTAVFLDERTSAEVSDA